MSKLILIRHGQASFGRSNYDQLSELGHKQALWLGEFFHNINLYPTRLISGSLQRHLQTTEALCKGLGIDMAPEIQPDWNEFDFHNIGRAYLAQHPEATPVENTPKAFFTVLRHALKAWAEEGLEARLQEDFSGFENRIQRAIDQSTAEDQRDQTVFVVSSGGAISQALRLTLKLDIDTLIDLNLQTRNTGISEFYFNPNKRYLSGFNAVPHLESAERRQYITSA